MSTEVILGLLGIGISIYYGVLGIRAVNKKKQNQKQNVSKGSISIQSGRDTKIGG